MGLSRIARSSQTLLVLLLVLVVGWDLWAVALDQRFRGTDTMFEAHPALEECGDLRCLLDGLCRGGSKGPVGRIITALYGKR